MGGPAVHERTAVLVVRAWLHGDPPVLAARITYTVDVLRPGEVAVAAAGVDDILDTVSRWLDEFVARAGDEPVTDA